MTLRRAKTFYLTAGLSLMLGLTLSARASFDINLLNAQFSTYVFVATNTGWANGLTDSSTAPAPCSDGLQFTQTSSDGTGQIGHLGADANASLFNVLVNTYFNGIGYFPARNATARAESTIWFSPTASGTATFELEHRGAYEWFYSQGTARLFDVTANETVWSHDWYFGFIPEATRIDNPDNSISFNYAQNADLDSSHVYSLLLREQSWADADRQFVSLQLNGLAVVSQVPEPSALALVALGFGALVRFRSSRRA
jgi:hypothetical protein